MTEPVIELDDVHRTYPGGVRAVRGVSLRIAPASLTALVGPSGSGKSTLLHLMGTLDLPSAGTVRLDGHDVAAMDDRRLSRLRGRRIGFVFQRFHLPGGVPATEIVADGLLYAGVRRGDRLAAAAEVLRQVGLGHRLDHRPHQLSGGEQQRVAVARAMVGRPSVLLADEPTGNLDTASGSEVMALLRDLRRSGTAVVVITHDPEIAAMLPRRIAVRDGRVVSDVSGAVAS
jgi:putative ABC transport system ATP-binding protein